MQTCRVNLIQTALLIILMVALPGIYRACPKFLGSQEHL